MVKNRAALRRKDRGNRRTQERSNQPDQETQLAEPVPENITAIFRSEELTELCRIWNVSDVRDVSPLVAAVALNKVPLVKRLIADGFCVDSRGPGGRTALLEAVRMRSLELVEVTAGHGADARLADDEGNTAPLLALRDEWWTQDAMLALCGSLPKLDVDRAAGAGAGHTLLHHAVRRKWEALVDALLERRAQVDCVTRRGVSPLMLAGCGSRWQVAQRLLAAGAGLLLEDVYGCTALCYACATLLVKGRNRETVDVMLRYLTVPLEDYLQRRLHLLRHPPCGVAAYAAPVSAIVAQALYCVSRRVAHGLRALLGVRVFAQVARSLAAHVGCAAYAHALLGLLFDLARHCACCTERAGVAADRLAAEFVDGGAPDACLAVLLKHCVGGVAQPLRLLPDPLMRLLVAAMLPLAVVFGGSPDAGVAWLARRGAELAPFYAVFRDATHVSVSARTDIAHLRLVRRHIRRFHEVYAGATTAQCHAPALTSELRLDARSLCSLDGACAGPDGYSLTSLASEPAVTQTTRSPLESVDDANDSSLSVFECLDATTPMQPRAEGKEVKESESRLTIENKYIVETNGQTVSSASELRVAGNSPLPLGKKVTKSNSQPVLETKTSTSTRRGEASGKALVSVISQTALPSGRPDITSRASVRANSQTCLPRAWAKASGQTTPSEGCVDVRTARAAERLEALNSPSASAPGATSTPKSAAMSEQRPNKIPVWSERARRKDAEVLEAYRLLPRALEFVGRGGGSRDTLISVPSQTALLPGTCLAELDDDSGLGISVDSVVAAAASEQLPWKEISPLIVIYDPTDSRLADVLAKQKLADYQLAQDGVEPFGADEVDEDCDAHDDDDYDAGLAATLGYSYDLPSGDRHNDERLSQVDLEIRQILNSLGDSVRGHSLFAGEDDGLGLVAAAAAAAGADECRGSGSGGGTSGGGGGGGGVGSLPKKSRIQVRLSDRRRLTIVDDLFTALVDALAARWHAEHAAGYPGHRVLLSAGQDLTLSHLHRLLPPLERLHLARLARRWRALSRKLRTGGGAASGALVGRLSALLQSHLAVIARGVPGALKRRASWQDVALRKRVHVPRDAEQSAHARRERVVERTRVSRRRTLKTLDTRGARAQNLKVIVPRRTKPASYNLKVIEPAPAGAAEPCRPEPTPPERPSGARYYAAHLLAPPPGFAAHRFDAHAAEFRPTRHHQDLQYVHNAVNVEPAAPRGDIDTDTVGAGAGVVDFASARCVVDYLQLDDDTDFEHFLRRRARNAGGCAPCAVGNRETENSCDAARTLHEKWVPLRQPTRASLAQDVTSLRVLRHDNLVGWETVSLSAAGLRIGCARMRRNLEQLVADADDEMDAERLLALCHQMARGLRFLHSVSVVHGNLKPTNVLVDERGVARLADFGLHLLKPPSPAVACLWWATETRAQFARRSQLVCTAESDAQALGMLFHYAATGGRHPFVVASATPCEIGCASYELRQLTQDLLQHESSLRPTLRAALRHVCWWDAHDRRSLVLRCAAWLADGCAEQSTFLDTALEPLLPYWKVRASDAMMCAAPDTPSAMLRMLHTAPQMTDSLLRWLPELPLALHRLAAQTPSLRTLLRFASHSTFDTI